MDQERFDALARAAADPASRRKVLRLLAGGAMAMALARLSGKAGAQVAATGRGRCRDEKEACQGDNQCCSGRCRKRRCRRSPNQGRCTIERDVCRDGDERCGRNGAALCHCRVTTAGASFCGGGGVSCTGAGGTPICDRDQHCGSVTGKGSRCVRLTAGNCQSSCAGGRGCQAPCPSLF